jgi:UDP-glucose 4-epimerase
MARPDHGRKGLFTPRGFVAALEARSSTLFDAVRSDNSPRWAPGRIRPGQRAYEGGQPAPARRPHVVVTGGAGFIGSHLCDALLERGYRVTCVDNLVGAGGTTRNVDHLLDHSWFELAIEDVLAWTDRAMLRDVACVFHLAASKKAVSDDDPERDLTVNALGTLKLLRAAARSGTRKFVLSSTGSVVGETRARHTENMPTLPVSYYGVSKLAAESYCRAVGRTTGLDYTILRYYHVIGPRQDSSELGGVVPIFVRRALADEPLTVDGDGRQTRSFTSVDDAVRANLIALEHPGARHATLTCASGVQVSIRELAEYVVRHTRSSSRIRHGPSRVGDIRWFDVDNTSLRRLGLEFTTDWRAIVRAVSDSLSVRRVA